MNVDRFRLDDSSFEKACPQRPVANALSDPTQFRGNTVEFFLVLDVP